MQNAYKVIADFGTDRICQFGGLQLIGVDM